MANKILVDFNGKVASISEHCRDLGISDGALYSRRKKTNESYVELFTHYLNLIEQNKFKSFSKHVIDFNGKTACLAEHCRDMGITVDCIYHRSERTGESLKQCLEYYQENGVKHNNKLDMRDKRLYNKWWSMMDRCYNPKNPNYPRYGGRKPKLIKVCDRWHKYKNFEDDLLESFLEHVEQYGISETTLDRYPNREGDYEPINIRWATRKEQQNNLTTNRMVTEDLDVAQFAEKYGLNHGTVLTKLNRGMTAQEILDTYGNKNGTIYYLPCNNGTTTLSQHCKNYSYGYCTICKYIKKYNLSPDKALAKYLEKRNKK